MRLAHWLRRSRPRHKGWNIGWDRHSFSPLLTTLECPDFGSAFDIRRELPPPDIALALTPNSLELTPGIQRRAYWEEVNPLLANWRSINDAKCPECARVIWVNMSRHLRLMHTTLVCYWRCPVPACPLWFTSELNGKDHIENIHHFKEGRGYYFYECLREFGLECFGSRAFFAEKKTTGQSLWMDIALARRSGQELRDSYTITGSPDFAHFRRFFNAAVNQLQLLYDDMPAPDFATSMPPTRSLIDCMRDDIYQSSASLDNTLTRHSPVEGLAVKELPVDLSSVPVVAPVRSLTPANWSLRFLETGAPGSPLTHELASRAAVPGMCIASTDLLSFINPLPMDRLALYDSNTVSRLAGGGQTPVTDSRTSRSTRSTQECSRPHAVSGRPGDSTRRVCRCRGGYCSSHHRGNLSSTYRRRPGHT